MNLNNYIIRWASIENIACRDYDIKGSARLYLDRTGLDRDPCKKIPVDKCHLYSNRVEYEDPNLRCRKYTSKKKEGETLCVSRSRIKVYEGTEKSNPVRSLLGSRKMRFLDTIPYYNTQDDRYDETIYGHVISHNWSLDDKTQKTDLYIIFNCSKVYDMNLLWEPEFEAYLEIFNKNYIMPFTDEYDKIILCGHSAGCVTALRFGYYLYQKTPDFFLERCMVIGSAPFCWLPKDKINGYQDLPNIKIFLNGSLYQTIHYRAGKRYTRDSLFVDGSIYNMVDGNRKDYRNISDFVPYYPMRLLYRISNNISNTKSKKIYWKDIYSKEGISNSVNTIHRWFLEGDLSKDTYFYKIINIYRSQKGGSHNYQKKYQKYYSKYKALKERIQSGVEMGSSF